ncbi:MAG: hypothetical protein ABFS41_14660 [Myxococcota bacterium]
MRSSLLALGSPLLICAAGHATEPGTPMDCSDLDLAPGLTCTEVTMPLEDRAFGGLDEPGFDNDGRLLAVGFGGESEGVCGPFVSLIRGLIVVAYDHDGNRSTLVSAPARCVDPTHSLNDRLDSFGAAFDPVRGSLLVNFASRCSRLTPGPGCPYTGPQGSRTTEVLSWVGRIDGFTPLADVLPRPLPLCANGIDDDGDGDVDLADAHCKSESDNDESRP